MGQNNIWVKNEIKNERSKKFNNFTTGSDATLDLLYFMEWDIKASKIYAKALWHSEIYTADEFNKISNALDEIEECRKLDEISPSEIGEDCHSYIEYQLSIMLGDIGKKIHTGRSRNDQSLTMIRMFMYDSALNIHSSLNKLKRDLFDLSVDNKDQVFIGYTHTQQAMITTLGHYYNSFFEQLKDDEEFLIMNANHIHQCPLGTGAGYGSPLDLNRKMISDELGFMKVQSNSMYCQNSRGKFELIFINCCSQIMLSLQRLATDMILYTSREFSFFDVDDALSQGSSKMPQKKNLDVFEIIRGKYAIIASLETRIQLILKGLPSGYNRDLQLIKEAIVEASEITEECIDIMIYALRYIKPNDINIRKAIKTDIYSADVVTSICTNNKEMNFRDTYKSIDINNLEKFKPEEILILRKSQGSPNNY